jgi:hypothetical protein
MRISGQSDGCYIMGEHRNDITLRSRSHVVKPRHVEITVRVLRLGTSQCTIFSETRPVA